MGNVISPASATISTTAEWHVNFEDVQAVINNNSRKYIIINTLSDEFQKCVIRGTLPAAQEESRINDIISGNDANGESVTIVVYGRNATDTSVYKKYEQLIKHGIANVRIYVGGMFEWLLLQDIYGPELFPTTGVSGVNLDLLAYRPSSIGCIT
jgi:hypothetical protein